MKKYFIFILTVFLYSCVYDPPSETVLNIYNFTDEAIYVYYSKYESIQITPKLDLFFNAHHQDIDELGNLLDSLGSPDYRINAHYFTTFVGRKKWQPFDDVEYVNFFFIKEATMKNYTWEEIVAKQMYVKKVRYTYDELEKMHYKIFYKDDKKNIK